jgi:hypothetical protein
MLTILNLNNYATGLFDTKWPMLKLYHGVSLSNLLTILTLNNYATGLFDSKWPMLKLYHGVSVTCWQY